MNWIKNHFDQNESFHPILKLIIEKENMAKNTEKNEIPEFFTKIPTFEKLDYSQIDSKLKNGATISEAFQSSKQTYQFDYQLFQDLYTILENQNHSIDQNNEHFIVVGLLYYILFYILDKDSPKTNDILTKMMQTLNNHRMLDYQTVLAVYYLNIIDMYMKIQDFEWELESISWSVQHFAVNKSDVKLPLSIYFDLFQKSLIYNNPSEINHMFDVVIQLLVDKNYAYPKEEIFKLLSIIDPFLKKFNTRALRIMSLLSIEGFAKDVKDNFLMVSSVFANLLINNPVSLKEQDFKTIENNENGSINQDDSKEFSYNFHSCDPHEFENGFKLIEEEKLLTPLNHDHFLNEQTNTLFKELFASVSNADSLCLDCLLSSFSKIILMYQNDEHFYDISYCFIMLVTGLSSQVSILPISSFLISDVIFHPSMTVFSSKGNSDVISYLRDHIIKILSESAPSLIAELITKLGINGDSNNSFLICEIIARILYLKDGIDFQVFTSDKCLISFAKTLNRLWRSFDDPLINIHVRKAFHTIMAFLFSLFGQENKNILCDCFNSSYFCTMLFNLLTEDKLMGFIQVTIRNYLLLDNKEYFHNFSIIETCLSDFFEKLSSKELDEARSIQVVTELCNTLLYDFSHNPFLISNFVLPLESILNFLLIKYSEDLLQLLLKLFAIVSSSKFKLSSKMFECLINAIKQAKNERNIYLSLINICGSSNALTQESLFLINSSSFLPLILASFGESKLIQEVLDNFIRLCKFSPTNCRIMHDSGIDTILLQYIRTHNLVTYRGVSFTLNFPNIDDVFSLIWLISREQSSYSICYQIQKLIMDPPNLEMASKILAAQVAESNYKRVHEFSLNNVFAKIENMSPLSFNKRFSFCFWIKIDSPLSLSVKNCQAPLLTIYNSNEERFTLFLSRDSFYYSFETDEQAKSTPQTNLGSIPSNEWVFCCFSCQRISIEKSLVGFFIKNTTDFCNEVNAMIFDQDYPLSFDFGGSVTCSYNDLIESKSALQLDDLYTIGTFGYSLRMMNEDDLVVLSQQDETKITDDTNLSFVFHSNLIHSEESLPQKFNLHDIMTTISPSNQMQNQENDKEQNQLEVPATIFREKRKKHSLIFMLANGNHLMSFVNAFNPSLQIPETFHEVIISMMKTILETSFSAQESFTSFPLIGQLLENGNSRLTYQLYTAFYSILEVLRSEKCIFDLFDGIIMNIKIWSKTQFFTRIVGHWANIVVTQYPSLFKRKSLFLQILYSFHLVLTEPIIQEKQKQTENREISNSFTDSSNVNISTENAKQTNQLSNQKLLSNIFSLMQRIGEIFITPKDFDFLFTLLNKNIAYFADTKPFLLLILKLISIFAPNFKEWHNSIDNQNILISLISNEDVSIVVSLIQCIHNFCFPQYFEIMLSVSLQLNSHPKKAEIFKELCNCIIDYPALFCLCSILALSLSDKEKELCSSALKLMASSYENKGNDSSNNVNESPESFVTGEELWHLFPVLLILQVKSQDCQNQILYFLKQFSYTSLQYIDKVLISIQTLSGFLHVDHTLISMNLIKDYDSCSQKDLSFLIFRILFFVYSNCILDFNLAEEFINSPFIEFNKDFTFEHFQVNNPLVLDELISQNNETYSIVFASSSTHLESYSIAIEMDLYYQWIYPLYQFLLKFVYTKRGNQTNESQSELDKNEKAAETEAIDDGSKENGVGNDPEEDNENQQDQTSKESTPTKGKKELSKTISIIKEIDFLNLFKMDNKNGERDFNPKVPLEILSEDSYKDICTFFEPKIRPKIENLLNQIHQSIIQSKSRVSTAITRKVIDMSISKYNTVKPYMIEDYIDFITATNLEKTIKTRSSHLSFSKCPSLFCYSLPKTYYDLILNDTNVSVDPFSNHNEINLSEIIHNEKNVISLPAVEYGINNEKTNVFVFFSPDKIQIVRKTKRIEAIHKDDIDFIIRREPSAVEIFLNKHISLFLDFAPLTTDDIITQLGLIDPIFTEQTEMLANIFQEKKEWSNYECLFIVSLFSDYTFHKKEETPLIVLNKNEQIEYEQFCIAENKDQFSKMIEKRKKCETSDVSSHFILLLGSKPEYNTIPELVKLGIGFSSQELSRAKIFGETNLCVFLNNEIVKVFKIEENTTTFISQYEIKINDSSIIEATNQNCIIYNKATLVKASVSNKLKLNKTALIPDMLSTDGDLILSVYDGCDVDTGTIIASFPEKITCIAGSSISAIFAVGTESCNIYVHSTVRHEFFSLIHLDEEPLSILLTDCFNIIVVSTCSFVYFYSVTGFLIEKIKKKMVCCSKFSIKGLDYITYADQSNKVWISPAYEPNTSYFIGETNSSIVITKILSHPYRLFVLTSNGMVYLFPVKYVI